MSIEGDITTALIAVLADLVTAGTLQKAVDPPPAGIEGFQLPLAYCYTGEAEYIDTQDDVVYISRLFRQQTAVVARGQASPATREARVRPVLEAVRDQYFAYSGSLGNLGIGIQDVVMEGDSGVALLPDWDGAFIGVEFRIRVIYAITKTYATGE